jgi:5-methylthioadenosine/S-adenosylhomocysteine deaminase
MKEAEASILHCPRPYLLGGATAPLARWLSMGLKVGLATDNVYHSMWETMRSTIYGARQRERMGEPRSPSYYDVLELATIRGAEVMGMSNMIGSLELGKRADIQLIDLKQPHIMPTADITSSLVLYGATVNVDTVMVDGEVLKKDDKITRIDANEAINEAQIVTEEIWDALLKDRPEVKKLLK